MVDYQSQWNPQGFAGRLLPMTSGVCVTGSIPTATTESPSKIRDSVSVTEQFLSDIHAAISELEERLDTVLTPCPPTGTSGDARNQAQAVASHLWGRLGILNEGFMAALIRLRALAARVEV